MGDPLSQTLTPPQRRYASQQDAATYYGVTDRTIRNWISRGLIHGYRLPGSRLVRVDLNELDSLTVPIPTAGGDAA